MESYPTKSGPTTTEIQDINTQMVESISELVEIGNTFNVDETMLENFSKSLKDDGASAYIKRKPHPYGAIWHDMNTFMKKTRLPLLLYVRAKTKTQKLAPRVALLQMANQASQLLKKPIHVIADMAFAAGQTFRHNIPGDVRFTIAFGWKIFLWICTTFCCVD